MKANARQNKMISLDNEVQGAALDYMIRLTNAALKLEDRCERIVILEFYIIGRPMKDIANMLGLSYKQTSRTKRDAVKHLEEQGQNMHRAGQKRQGNITTKESAAVIDAADTGQW